MQMQTAAIIAVLAGLITTALMVVVGQFVTPEGQELGLDETMRETATKPTTGGETGGKTK